MRTARLALLATIAGLPACAGRNDPDGPCVLLLVLDGVRTTEFSSTTTSPLTGTTGQEWAPETWKELAPQAAVVRSAINPGITITEPSHAEMFTSRVEPYANFPIEDHDVGLYRPEHPTIFEEARAQLGLGEDDAVFVANTELLEGVTAGLYPGYDGGARYEMVTGPDDLPSSDDTDVFDTLKAEIDAGAPRVLVANVHDIDRAGHFGEEGAYQDNIQKVDKLLPDFWDWLQRRHPKYASNLMVVITSDHGRHDTGEDEDWRSHGDACSGCRQVPMLVLGSGAKAGEIVEGSITELDVMPTLAAHLGVDLPWGEGLPLTTLVDGVDGAVRSGDTDVSASRDLVGTRAWRDDPDARSEVRVGDTVLSTPGVFAAEAPSVLSGDADWACFRELDLSDETAGAWPWVERCLRRDGEWTDLGFPAEEVGPLTRVAMVEHGGGLWVAWNNNPNGIAELGSEYDVGLAVASWSETGWSARTLHGASFPTDPVMVPVGTAAVVAYATNHAGNDARNSRRVEVASVTHASDGLAIGEPTTFTLSGLLGDPIRVERPALGVVGDTVWLAMIGYGADDRAIAVASSADAGATWSAASLLPVAGDVLPNVSPAWDGEWCVWAALVDGDAQLCRAKPGDAAPACVPVGSPRIDSFAVHDGVATVSLDRDVGSWAITGVSW
jgi:hypothetical protein